MTSFKVDPLTLFLHAVSFLGYKKFELFSLEMFLVAKKRKVSFFTFFSILQQQQKILLNLEHVDKVNLSSCVLACVGV